MEVKIGVLLPRSDMFPKLAIDFLNGFKLPFKKSDSNNITPKFSIESIGNASDSELLRKVEQMMLQDETDIIVCFCSYFLLENLVIIANSYKKSIIHVSLGARVLKPIHYSPYVIHQSLNLCHTSYLSGKYAVESLGKRIAMLSSFYDGGYHLAEAFFNGVHDHGGEIVYNYVSPMDYKLETYQAMVDGIEKSKPDVLFSIFSYKEGNKVLTKFMESGLDAIPNIAIPLMTDESMAFGDSVPKNMQSIASWAFEDDSVLMNDFCSNYENLYDELPNIFSLLGDEVGTIILQSIEKEGKIPNKIGDYIKAQNVTTSRGKLNYTELNESIPETFKIRKFEMNQGMYQNSVIEVLDSSFSEIIYKKMQDLPFTGWKNPYICT